MIVILSVLRILAALVIFGIIVVIHEWGHFIVAKLCGVQVNEFAIGMGPKLLKWGKKETKYSLRLLPIGGFCAMEGEDAAGGGEVSADVTPTDNPRAFYRKKVWQRMLITVAGAAMNLVLGFVLLVVNFAVCTAPSADGNTYYAGTAISWQEEGSTSAASGLQVGDTILKIDGKSVFSVFDIQSLLQESDGDVSMTVRRDGARTELPSVKFHREYNEASGRYILHYDFKVNAIKSNVWTTVEQSARTECSVAVMVWRSLGGLLTGKYGLNELSGPVGTVDVIGDTVADAVASADWRAGLSSVLMLVILLTVNVGIFNLLPIPALDGGRMLFLIWEGVTRRPVPQKYEAVVHAIGFVLLLILIVIVTFSDVIKLFG